MDLDRCSSWESTGSEDALLEWCLGYSKVGMGVGREHVITKAYMWLGYAYVCYCVEGGVTGYYVD